MEEARLCLETWGFRRCEVITWVKTNHSATFSPSPPSQLSHLYLRSPNSLFLHTSEHCLVGVRGNVRNTDSSFIHPNLDVDVIVDEERARGDLSKPQEIFHIIERFCLGKDRLYLFASENELRSGWVCVGEGMNGSNMIALERIKNVKKEDRDEDGQGEYYDDGYV
jgi:N6-adenosine-specific RNA methylase IME4